MFLPIDPSLLFSRGDQADPRLGDLTRSTPAFAKTADFKSWLESQRTEKSLRDFVIAGYPDDEGIRINGGRIGASQAPLAVRKPLYKMTPSALRPPSPVPFSLYDLGNLNVADFKLDERHATATEYAKTALQAGAKWISIGGGHDYGFADADAFLSLTKSNRPLVINFDAHLDVRPTQNGLSSGTPFFRMLEKYPGTAFLEIGLQAQCNAQAHLTWAKSRGAKILFQEDLMASGKTMLAYVQNLLGAENSLGTRPAFLSIDIDGFSSSVAPGCSQSWATGFMPEQFFPCFEWLISKLDVRALGIYEVSPPLDQDDRTSKLAALIIHRFLSGAK